MKEEKIHFTDSKLLDLLDEAVCTIGFQKLMQRFLNVFPDLIPRINIGASDVYTFRFLMENYFNKIEKLGLGNKQDLVVDHVKSVSVTEDTKRLDWLCTKRGADWFDAYLTFYSETISRAAVDTVMREEK